MCWDSALADCWAVGLPEHGQLLLPSSASSGDGPARALSTGHLTPSSGSHGPEPQGPREAQEGQEAMMGGGRHIAVPGGQQAVSHHLPSQETEAHRGHAKGEGYFAILTPGTT